jgi:allantoate deiminase
MLTGGARAVARCDELGVAPYSDLAGGLYRAWLTPAHRAALDKLAEWMKAAGMAVRLDPLGNLIGHYPGAAAEAPLLLIGSHIDSVRDGGRYDGPLGIMLGVECVAALHGQGRHLTFGIEVVAFGDEEGSRFPAAMLTSRALAGTLESVPLAMEDAQGVSLGAALAAFGLSPGITPSLAPSFRPSLRPIAYFEAHIEQGPVLEAEGLALGTVTGIAAQARYAVIVKGTAGHAGTTAMGLRADALAGAAEMVLAIEAYARADASDLVATVGRIEALPGATNVIPGEVRFTLDIRAGEEAHRDVAAEWLLEALAAIASQRGLGLATERTHVLPASPCDPVLMDLLDAALADIGQPRRRLVSGAGHDAMVMAALCPTAMLFIRCRGGVSHNPAESVDPADAELALAAMLAFLERLGDTLD